jgi:hypothetical protein
MTTIETPTANVTFTKNSRTGKFDIIGPVSAMVEGATLTVVTKSGGAKQVVCGKPSRPFVAKFGVNAGSEVAIAAFQWVASKPSSAGPRHYAKPSSSGRKYECEDCGNIVVPGTSCWETGLTH